MRCNYNIRLPGQFNCLHEAKHFFYVHSPYPNGHMHFNLCERHYRKEMEIQKVFKGDCTYFETEEQYLANMVVSEVNDS